MPDAQNLTTQDVLRVAKLARLAITTEQAEGYRAQLAAILDHAASLNTLDLDAVEPLTHPHALEDRTDEDTPGPTIPNEILMALAPDADPPFIKVPKVLADSSDA